MKLNANKKTNKITKSAIRTRGKQRTAFDVSKCYAVKPGKASKGETPMCMPGLPGKPTTRSRMRAQIEKALARITPGDWMVPPAWFEEIEKRPIADVLADWVFTCKCACISERDTAQFAVRHMLSRRIKLPDALARQLVRGFYHAGDCSLKAAIERATACGVGAIPDGRTNAGAAKVARSARGISCADEQNAVTLRITGKAFANLKRITELFAAWDEREITPAELFFEYFTSTNEAAMNLDTRKPGKFQDTLPGALCGMYGGASDVGALCKAFERAGFTTRNGV